ncbi:MAG: hypothetical protein IJD14_01025 [Christensenellaceae bacterium]|nr:hypothetical protein [Christensenellaceae bacterium]
MGKMSLYMLKVFSDVPAALVIDSTVAAHTDKEGTAVTVSGSEMFVQIYALMGNYPPICRYISLEHPYMKETDERCELYMLSESVFEFHAYFNAIGSWRSLPYVLSTINAASDKKVLRASVYCDREFALAIEEGDKVIVSKVFNGNLKSAQLYLKQVANTRLLFAHASGSDGDHLKIVRFSGEIEIVLERQITKIIVEENSITLNSVIYDTEITEVFTSDLSRPQDIRPHENTPQGLLATMVYAAICGHEQAAMRLMDPSLSRDVSFSDLKEFIENPLTVRKHEQGLMLVYAQTEGVSHARILKAAVKNEKIVNIEEI